MKLENEFTVNAPLEQTWDVLLDVERVAGCLPGARVAPSDREGMYDGQMRVKLGAMTVAYKGTLSMTEIDPESRRVVMQIDARELKGQGGAKARMENRLIAESDARTRIHVGTELDISGRTAQLGRGMMQNVAGRLLDDFAQRLEREMVATAHGNGTAAADHLAGAASAEHLAGEAPAEHLAGAAPGDPLAEHTRGESSEDAQDVEQHAPNGAPLDLGAVAIGALGRRPAVLAGAAVVLAALVAGLRPRRRRDIRLVLRERRGMRTRTFELRIGR
jgi:uncharacterized protein